MFEITAEEIALLNDEDLRSLVGRLCESELRRRGISPACVTWGGNQRAADGGLDVRVALPQSVETHGFIPRQHTGFQAKAEDMPRSKILSEMRPKGRLRSAIRELAGQSAAYVIVCSRGSVSDSALQNRRRAMAEAVSDLPSSGALALDFYDRRKLETWLREHPTQVPWVREKIGRPRQGWSSFGPWANPAETANGEYLIDGEARIRTGGQTGRPDVPVIEGIGQIRSALRNPQGVVRLVGLSGLGKTRLAQALFDDRVGKDALDPFAALYTNLADTPNPSPIELADELILTGQRAILVVDNCPAELHRRLFERCRSAGSKLSVLTIEYDIREDQPEGTDVFALEPASVNLIERLVRHRFRQVSQTDALRVASFSGGNARIAIALAETIGKSETIAKLSDDELFRRLFEQRHQADEHLLSAAQALSLVYSFLGGDVTKDNGAELYSLGTLIGKSAQDMFKYSAELERRGLVQRRGPWRAVLPHALANRLASTGLENISRSSIEECFLAGGQERLLKSFSRRLGYLNGSREARSMVTGWLKPGGLLSDVPNLDDLDRELFINVTPVAPKEALEALERAVLGPSGPESAKKCKLFLRPLRSIAYDPALFARCVTLIREISETGDVEQDTDEGRRVFVSLFPMLYSGTHATIEQRLAVVEPLLRSEEPKKRSLGLGALVAALEASHFGPPYDFEFGARSRDYGYRPVSQDEQKSWFGKVLTLAESLACSDELAAPQVRNIVAMQFRGLWNHAHIHDELEKACRSISARLFWKEGWIAVRQTLYSDHESFPAPVSRRLAAIEELLRPKDLLEQVQAIVLSDGLQMAGLDVLDDEAGGVQASYDRIQRAAEELGRKVVAEEGVFAQLLPELWGPYDQLLPFGGGLAQDSDEPRATWERLVVALWTPGPEGRYMGVLWGFLNALNAKDPELAGALLDGALRDERLSPHFPFLQTATPIDHKGVERLMQSLELGKAPIDSYYDLARGGAAHTISGPDFSRLLLRIAAEPDGLDIAARILGMRISFARSSSSPSELVDIGCNLMRRVRFSRRGRWESYDLGIIARKCLVGEKGSTTVWQVCRNLRDAVAKSNTHAYYHADLLQILIAAQPQAALDGLCGGGEEGLNLGASILNQAAQFQSNPFAAIPEADLLAWCDQQPEARYPVIAAGVTPFQMSGEGGRPRWTSFARTILDKAPDRVAVLREFVGKFRPTMWTGSLAAIVASNFRLLDELGEYPDPALTEFIAKEKLRFRAVIEGENRIQELIDRRMEERFE